MNFIGKQGAVPVAGDTRIERQLVELAWERYRSSAVLAPSCDESARSAKRTCSGVSVVDVA